MSKKSLKASAGYPIACAPVFCKSADVAGMWVGFAIRSLFPVWILYGVAADDSQPAKRLRTDGTELEEDFIASNKMDFTLPVVLPNLGDKYGGKLTGQTLQVKVKLTDKVREAHQQHCSACMLLYLLQHLRAVIDRTGSPTTALQCLHAVVCLGASALCRDRLFFVWRRLSNAPLSIVCIITTATLDDGSPTTVLPLDQCYHSHAH